MCVILGIIKAPVLGEQLGILFLAFSHLLGLRGLLKVLYRDKSKGRGVSFFIPITRKCSIPRKDPAGHTVMGGSKKSIPTVGQSGQDSQMSLNV